MAARPLRRAGGGTRARRPAADARTSRRRAAARRRDRRRHGRRDEPAAPGPADPSRTGEEETARPAPAPAEPAKPEPEKSELAKQGQADADRKSAGCVTCHTKTDSQSMHTATTVKLGCIDCHGGKVEVTAPDGASRRLARRTRRPRSRPTCCRRTREVWRDLGEPRARLHGAPRGEPGVRAVRQPRRPARRAPHVRRRRLPSDRGRAGREEHDDARRPMLWGAALYNNGVLARARARASARATAPTARRSAAHDRAAADRRGDGEEGRAGRSSTRCRAGSSASRATCCASSSAAAAAPARDRHARSLDEQPGKPDNRLSERGLGTLNRTDPGLPGPAEDAAARSAALVARAPTTSPATTARAAAPAATSSTRTTARRCTRASTRSSATAG